MTTITKPAISINEKLFNLQQEIGTISKDATNPFYKSKYFDINSLIKQLQPLFKKHRIFCSQPVEGRKVYTKLICIDTERAVISWMKIPKTTTDPQKVLACTTYYRRGTLTSLLGLQAVDDDGNTASGKGIDKPFLNKDSIQMTKAIEFLKLGGNMERIEQKYKVSKPIKDVLLKL